MQNGRMANTGAEAVTLAKEFIAQARCRPKRMRFHCDCLHLISKNASYHRHPHIEIDWSGPQALSSGLMSLITEDIQDSDVLLSSSARQSSGFDLAFATTDEKTCQSGLLLPYIVHRENIRHHQCKQSVLHPALNASYINEPIDHKG